MPPTQPHTVLPRFPLFGKFIAGFSVIILFMVGASIVILLQLKPVFLSDQLEFQSIQLSQSLKQLFDAELEASRKFLTSKNAIDARTMRAVSGQFQTLADSLLRITAWSETRASIVGVIEHHQQFVDFVAQEGQRIQTGSSYDASGAIAHAGELGKDVQSGLVGLTEYYLPLLTKALRSFEQRRDIAISGATYILILTLVVATVFGFLLARTLTRPIQALKSGTQKVGEGHFEIVSITTNDEVADLTRAFNLMSEKLKQLDEMRMQLMSEISHEMRTPLQVIKAGCYTILHAKDVAPLNQRQRDAVGMIHQATNRINQFVNSFLDVAKMEAGLMKFNFVDANVVEFLTPLIQEAQLIAQSRQIKLDFIVDEVPSLRVDKERMSQVISNLLSNALKYTPNDGTINVRITNLTTYPGLSSNGKGCVRIAVEDSGVGIPAADLNKLFSKFFQANNTPQVNEKGSGLGLALVKHVTEAHGGRVSVESTPGVGSTFSVILPA
jgi:two-component system sensor histidine kinase GlrK